MAVNELNFSSWTSAGVDSSAGWYVEVFLLLSSRWRWNVLFSLVLFRLLAGGEISKEVVFFVITWIQSQGTALME